MYARNKLRSQTTGKGHRKRTHSAIELMWPIRMASSQSQVCLTKIVFQIIRDIASDQAAFRGVLSYDSDTTRLAALGLGCCLMLLIRTMHGNCYLRN